MQFTFHLTGKLSRKTGLHLFISDLYKGDTQSGESWEQKRERIFKAALERWKCRTYEMLQLREKYTKMAKEINKQHNMKRCLRLMVEDHNASIQKERDSEILSHQLHVLTAALQGNLLCPNGLIPSVPSVVRPHALTDFAQRQSVLPLPDIDSSSLDAIVMCADDDPKILVGRDISESALFLTDYGHGIHGLGDQEFGVSRAIVESLSERTGFVNDSDRQFQATHSQVCDNEVSFSLVSAGDDIEQRKSCQELCGRFCRKDITDVTLFRNFVEMIKSIARIVSSRRDIKHGNTVFMSPTCKLPVLIIQSPTGLFARLSSRFCFSPLEVDWLHCGIEVGGASEDVLYRVTLTFNKLADSDSSYLCPSSDNMCELAIWLCRNFVTGPEFKCQLFLDYDLDEHYDHILLLRSDHLSSTSVSPDGDSFRALLNQKDKKRRIQDEDEELNSVGMMLSVLSNKNKKKPQGSRQSSNKTPSTTSQLLAGRSTRNSVAYVVVLCEAVFCVII